MKIDMKERDDYMMNKTYLRWLGDKIDLDYLNTNEKRTEYRYVYLVYELCKKEFFWTVPNDDNRRTDGLKLREQFYEETGRLINDRCMCNMLEVLIALAERFESLLTEPIAGVTNYTAKFFWEMIGNLGLDRFTDDVYLDHCDPFIVSNVLDRVLERNYSRSGAGGLFPLRNPKKDQRRVELWYQMSAYLLENYYSDDEN